MLCTEIKRSEMGVVCSFGPEPEGNEQCRVLQPQTLQYLSVLPSWERLSSVPINIRG